MIRKAWIDSKEEMPISRQCAIAGVPRSSIYANLQEKEIDASEVILKNLIDEEYARHPFYGSRKMVIYLRGLGYVINRKKVRRLMKEMGLSAIAPGPKTSIQHPENKVYPYLLRGVEIIKPNQVWSIDITYIRVGRGFVYLAAIIDWYSRKVLSWRISNTMDTSFCIDCLQTALRIYGKPEIFNSDQGSQFTSIAFTDILKEKGITISMDGRGRVFDNIFVERLWRSVKFENTYLNGYSQMSELIIGLTNYFAFYNNERPHQSLNYKTPNFVYQTGTNGGAMIIDKYPKEKTLLEKTKETIDLSVESDVKKGQRLPAVYEVESTT